MLRESGLTEQDAVIDLAHRPRAVKQRAKHEQALVVGQRLQEPCRVAGVILNVRHV
jgi:hypothetical protein